MDKQTLKQTLKKNECKDYDNCKNLLNIYIRNVKIYENNEVLVKNLHNFYKKINVSLNTNMLNNINILSNCNNKKKECSNVNDRNYLYFESFLPIDIYDILFTIKWNENDNIFSYVYSSLLNHTDIMNIPYNILFYAYIKIIQYSLNNNKNKQTNNYVNINYQLSENKIIDIMTTISKQNLSNNNNKVESNVNSTPSKTKNKKTKYSLGGKYILTKII